MFFRHLHYAEYVALKLYNRNPFCVSLICGSPEICHHLRVCFLHMVCGKKSLLHGCNGGIELPELEHWVLDLFAIVS